MQWGITTEYRGDLNIHSISSERGSGGGQNFYMPWPEEEDEDEEAPRDEEPEAALESEDQVCLSEEEEPTPAAIQSTPLHLRLLCLDFHLHWATLLAAAAARPSLSRPTWDRRRSLASIRNAMQHTRPLPLTPCEAVATIVESPPAV